MVLFTTVFFFDTTQFTTFYFHFKALKRKHQKYLKQ
jgi:hypothetical protein